MFDPCRFLFGAQDLPFCFILYIYTHMCPCRYETKADVNGRGLGLGIASDLRRCLCCNRRFSLRRCSIVSCTPTQYKFITYNYIRSLCNLMYTKIYVCIPIHPSLSIYIYIYTYIIINVCIYIYIYIYIV